MSAGSAGSTHARGTSRRVVSAVAVVSLAVAAHAAPIIKIPDVPFPDYPEFVVPVRISEATPGTMQSFIASVELPEGGYFKSIDARTGTVWSASALVPEYFYGDTAGNYVSPGSPAAVRA